jgi:hypothetical protein
VTWQVGPLLVRSGNPVQITWKARNVASCAVQGTNGDGSDGTWTGLSGTRTSSNITQQTTYSLVCQALAGAQPQTVASSTIVNIVPVFTEP